MSAETKETINTEITRLRGVIMYQQMGSRMNHDVVAECQRQIAFLQKLLAA